MAVVENGVSSNTPERLLLDAGVVYTGWTSIAVPGTLLGATKGGSVLEINRTIRDIRPDGSKGPVKGFRRIEECVATLTVNLIEVTQANLTLAIAGCNTSTYTLTGGEIEDGDYIGTVAYVLRHSGFAATTAPLFVTLSNCLVDGPFTITGNPKDEAVIKLVFKAHYADSDLSTEPWSIVYPS